MFSSFKRQMCIRDSRYSCLKMDNITRTVSPVNVRLRLYYCGMRSINLLADLTNYIMLELGQPTHAFDAHKIHHIVVNTPDAEMNFTTLDGTERKIEPNMLMIWDEEQPVAIAGIMGGLDSEIVDNTTSVVLESANFDGVSVRKSSSALGLRTDASMRYEKILDPELTVIAVKRFVRLVQQIDPEAKIASCMTDVYVQKYPVISLSFDKAYVDRYTGIDIGEEQICQTLRSLGFGVNYADGNFTVEVPSWRATKDVTIKADIIEEITRIYGYDNFAISTTRSKLHPVKSTVARTEENALKDLLVPVSYTHLDVYKRQGEYITVDKDGFITLTDSGKEIAAKIYERHTMLTDFLIRLGVEEETAAADACKIEHDISDRSFEAIKKHVLGNLNKG